jgi:hypothetical protein
MFVAREMRARMEDVLGVLDELAGAPSALDRVATLIKASKEMVEDLKALEAKEAGA